MLLHLLNLLFHSFFAIPGSLGSNWLGLIFPVGVVIAGEVIAGFVLGWDAVISNWKRATGIGFAALALMYTLLFGWCVVTTTYGDHLGLANRVVALRHTVDADAGREQSALISVRQELGSQISDLQQSCAEMRGANGVLTKQTIDQQSSINSCQTQALKLLTPEPQKLTILTWEDKNLSGSDHQTTYLLLTNKEVNPTRIDGSCDVNLATTSAKPVENMPYSGGANIIQHFPQPSSIRYNQPLIEATLFQIVFSLPAWEPTEPIRLDITYKSSRPALCHFNVR